MHLNYAREKLGDAVACLVGPETIRRRLWHAYLRFHPLQPKHLPAELGKQWESLGRSLVAIRALDETSGRLEATLSFADEADLADIARQIFEIYCAVLEASE